MIAIPGSGDSHGDGVQGLSLQEGSGVPWEQGQDKNGGGAKQL